MPHLPQASSRVAARRLLAAWNSGDVDRLGEALIRNENGVEAASDEQERIQIVGAASQVLTAWLRSPKDLPEADLKASLGVLRQLAGEDNRVTNFRTSSRF